MKEIVLQLQSKITISFSDYYRENRHGTKITKAVVKSNFSTEKNFYEETWDIKVKIPQKEKTVIFEIPEEVPRPISDAISTNCTYSLCTEIFSNMKKSKGLKK